MLSSVLAVTGSAKHHGFFTYRAGGDLFRRATRFLATAFGEPLCRQLLAVPAFLDKLRFERLDLLIEQIVGLVDKANERVSPYLRFFVL